MPTEPGQTGGSHCFCDTPCHTLDVCLPSGQSEGLTERQTTQFAVWYGKVKTYSLVHGVQYQAPGSFVCLAGTV
jgi:hypothetical protein